MPNWCQNTVSISGSDVPKLKEWLGDGTKFLSRIVPTPQQLVDTVSGWNGDPEEQKKLEAQQEINLKEYGSKDWYDWNVKNWGTKWDVDVEIDDFDSTDTDMTFSFESAWSPPTQAIEKLSELFPNISIRHSYLEEGCGFVGVLTIEEGVVSDICHDDPKTDAWKEMASEEFGWEPWVDDEDESSEN